LLVIIRLVVVEPSPVGVGVVVVTTTSSWNERKCTDSSSSSVSTCGIVDIEPSVEDEDGNNGSRKDDGADGCPPHVGDSQWDDIAADGLLSFSSVLSFAITPSIIIAVAGSSVVAVVPAAVVAVVVVVHRTPPGAIGVRSIATDRGGGDNRPPGG
jgi:hypothetical protein